jgi:uncharacterized membrane protein YeiH
VLYWIEHIAVTGCAISGVLAAAGRKVDLFGVIVLAIVTAFGGGTLRDVILGDLPVFWIRDTRYLYTVVVAAVFAFFAARRFAFPESVLQATDAAGTTVFAALRRFGWEENQAATLGIVIVLGLRLAAIRWKLSLPLFRKHDEPEH